MQAPAFQHSVRQARKQRRARERTARAPALKQGQPELAIISTSSMTRSARLRQARKPWMHSTCAGNSPQW